MNRPAYTETVRSYILHFFILNLLRYTRKYILNLITLTNFKKFEEIKVDLKEDGVTLVSGVNNSGKTSLLHALAVWEYAKILLINYRGRQVLLKGYNVEGKGLGIAPESFSPISIPSLKYLWKDQKANGAYRLKIKVGWKSNEGDSLFLEIAYTLNGNNFAIKMSDSNLSDSDEIPTIAYLPPFGGMSENESWLSVADRRKLIGKGQAGAVIRNLLLDLHKEHEAVIEERRKKLFPNKKRLTKTDQEALLKIDTEWRQLKEILSEVFHVQLFVHDFDSQFHNFVTVDVIDLVKNPVTNLKEKQATSKRDLMVEGSGFLQWLSVFALALDKNNDILLLDEPDAHLHSSLQALLIEKLEQICEQNKKQILMVSHSSDLIKIMNYQKVLHVEESKACYLKNNEQKVLVLEGLGSKYFPLLDSIVEHRRILLVENDSDARTLKYVCQSLGQEWPQNLVVWVTNKKHKERKTLVIELNQKIFHETKQTICAYSLRDLDDQNYSTTNAQLHENGNDVQYDDSQKHIIMKYRTLRRREIENYLVIPEAISRYISSKCKDPEVSKSVEDVNQYLIEKHGLVVPSNYRKSDREGNTQALFCNDVKPVFEQINRHFRVKFDKEEYIQSIAGDEVCDDLRTIVSEIVAMCE
ncbi:ATP-dependent nuclease [Alteromonas sp.]|uniref:ATP-dependent nuclease n=1 Tax=Alteromonas sp. TaxID=232 RepID=UPI0025800901|nr:AAA family ATPase [Alteromonas sp.]NQY16721.1 AAA family ATPase [Alteromonas sp.]